MHSNIQGHFIWRILYETQKFYFVLKHGDIIMPIYREYVGKYVFDTNNEIVIRKSFFVDENVVVWNGRFENKRLIVLVEIINTKCKEFDWF